MVLYKCDKCEKIFDHKGNYEKHIQRTMPCQKEKAFKCRYCASSFTFKNNLQAHEKNICKEKDKQKCTELELLKEEVKELKNIITSNTFANVNNSIINSNINSIVNNTININLVCYGQENIKGTLTKKELKSVFEDDVNKSLVNLAKLVFFNKKYLQFRNFKEPESVRHRKTYLNVLKMENGKEKWSLMPRKEFLFILLKRMDVELNDLIDIDEEYGERYNKFSSRFDFEGSIINNDVKNIGKATKIISNGIKELDELVTKQQFVDLEIGGIYFD